MDLFDAPVDSCFPVSKQYFECIPSDSNLLCKNCPRHDAKIVPRLVKLVDKKRPWFVQFRCPVCRYPFYWCRVCKPSSCFIRSEHMRNDKDLKKHDRFKTHLNNLKKFLPEHDYKMHLMSLKMALPHQCFEAVAEMPLSDPVDNSADDIEMQYSDPIVDNTDPIVESCHPNSSHTTSEANVPGVVGGRSHWKNAFPGHFNPLFFKRQHTSSGLGLKKIASRAIHHDEIHTEIPVSTGLFLLMKQRLRISFSKFQADTLAYLFEHALLSSVNSSGILPDVPLPTNVPEMNASYGKKNKFSVRNSIPKLKIHRVGDYMVVKPSDCLREVLAFGLADVFYPGESILHSTSPRGQELIDIGKKSKTLLAGSYKQYHLLLWEDELDPSNVKDNRTKVFVQVLTVAPKDSTVHTTRNTFIICVGPSDKDRTLAQRMIADDLLQLKEGIECYHRDSKRFVPTVALVFSVQADSPAKASATRLLAGNSPFHCRFGYVGDISYVIRTLRSCSRCWNARKDGILLETECKECHDWSFRNLSYPKPTDYPRVDSDDNREETLLPFKRITMESAKVSVRTIIDNVRSGEWTIKAKARCFAKCEGFSQKFVEEILEFAETSPKRPDEFEFPPSWDYPGTCFSSWVPVPMHQLFLGVVKATFGEFVSDYLVTQRQKTAYMEYVSELLGQVRDLKLSWLIAETLSNDGRFGRFVSENYLCFGKIGKWLFGNMRRMSLPDTPYADPTDKRLSEYTVVELKAWLKARHLPYPANSRKEDLYQVCVQAIEDNGGTFPAILPPTRQGSTIEDTENLVSALHAMLSRIMIRGAVTDDDARDCDRHIKHFLSTVAEYVSKEINPPGSSRSEGLPDYITKYNFINLLNIPDAMLKFFSLRLVWEGDGKGEGALPLLKQKSIQSLLGDWAYNALKNYIELRAIDRCIAEAIHNLDDEGTESNLKSHAEKIVSKDLHYHKQTNSSSVVDHHSTTNRKKEHKVYKNEASFLDEWRSANKPLTVAQLDNGTFCALCKNGIYIELQVDPDCRENVICCGAAYFKWIASEASSSAGTWSYERIKENFVFLPHHSTESYRHYYYVITSDWEEMLPDGSIGRSQATGMLYR